MRKVSLKYPRLFTKRKPIILRDALGVPDWGFKEVHSTLKYFLYHRKTINEIISKLERQICSSLRVRFCITTNFGREALYIALRTLDLRKGDGVILPSFICSSILYPILSLGGIPQFVDIGEDLNIDTSSLLERITPVTKIIMMPHLFGKPAQVESVMKIAQEKKLFVIDDAAQALGGKYKEKFLGTKGDFGILSFGPFKGIGATRGGALLADNEELYRKAKQISLREEPMNEDIKRFVKYFLKFRMRKYTYFLTEQLRKKEKRETWNINFTEYQLKPPGSKISGVDASIVICQLNKLAKIINKRKGIAYRLLSLLKDIQQIKLPNPENGDHIFTKFVILLKDNWLEGQLSPAEAFVSYLRYHGIEAEPWCYIPLHLNWRFESINELTKTEKIWRNIVGLPIHTNMTNSDINYMSEVIRGYFK